MANTREQQLNSKLDYLDDTKNIIKTALEEQGVTISDTDTFRDYAEKIKTMRNGDVLLFESTDEMEAYENPKEGILAIIYSANTSEVNMYSTFQYIVFPKEVTLSQACTNTIEGYIRGEDGNYIGRFYIDGTQGYFYIHTDTVSIDINYTSTDGINYTRQEDITNPINVNELISLRLYNLDNQEIVRQFIKYEDGNFVGLYKYINGVFVNVSTQFNLTKPNQLLTNYRGYGDNQVIEGDGSYISNIKTSEYIDKYFPTLVGYTDTRISSIQQGTMVGAMTYIQREQITSTDAFETDKYNADDCIAQFAQTENISVENSTENKVIIQNYLSAQERYNYAFFIGNTAYRLYLGYNYSTKQQESASSGMHTVPYQMTSLYAFIVNLEDLSIYRTFVNTDSWTFTGNGFGNLLTYAYSVKSDQLVLLTDMDGWLSTGGAYIGLTTITTSGARTTKYFNLNYSSDYAYKKVCNTSYDNSQNCYYLAYKSETLNGDNSSIRRIIKLTPEGNHSSIYESTKTMSGINSLWNNYFKSIGSLLCYSVNDNSMQLRNLATNKEITLYGSVVYSLDYFGINGNKLYVSHKPTEDTEKYNVYEIDMNTLETTMIPDTASTYRLSNAFYTYNRNLCVFIGNKIISLSGETLARFMPTMLNNVGISGIDKIDDYTFKASFADYSLQININSFTAKIPTYRYYRYADITKLPVTNDLCIVTNSRQDNNTNDNCIYYKYNSLPLTDLSGNNQILLDKINQLQSELDEANSMADIIQG